MTLTRKDLSGVRDACNNFLLAYLWGIKDGEEINGPVALAAVRELRNSLDRLSYRLKAGVK